ncbi:DUF6896 domain-containing protein [Corallococcus sp. RDP092CA]|uniref:DUF6896 domain-containing protein n=1 Tax=Corallococcus sp. RDP092CA TaxID=3109369 RepID=UPI0035B284BC
MQGDEWILDLIEQYLESARSFSDRLCRAFGQKDLLSGRRSKVIPRKGIVPGGLEFDFHGIGCRFSDGSFSVDVDFTPEGKVSGFDSWRLHAFSAENASFGGVRSHEDVAVALENLLAQGLIERLPGSHLYRLRAMDGA